MSGLRLSGGDNFISSAEVNSRTIEMADHYYDYFGQEEVVIMTVLQGASHFAADLGRALALKNPNLIADRVEIKTMKGVESVGEPKIKVDWRGPLPGRNLLIVEDIWHTSKTLDYLLNIVDRYDPAKVAVAALIDKPTARPDGHSLKCDDVQVGFQVVDEFVVGGGLDWNDRYRFMSHISKAHNVAEPGQPPLWVPIVPDEYAIAA